MFTALWGDQAAPQRFVREGTAQFWSATYLLKAIEIGVDVLYVVTGRHVPAAVKALTQEQLDILNYMSGMSEQNRADLVRVGRAMYDANQFRRMAPANSLS
ncbi:hypothetical protein [Pseudomonas aeruginosa]|uniref:hypothetical protein n=1 Tax=Pseudomonas aeruginosa TaxID=287 RepID=UPI003D7FC6C4